MAYSGYGGTMKLQEFYEELNGNYEDVKSRLTNEDRIEKFVIRFLEDDSFQKIVSAREHNNDMDVFRAIHTLKGISLNMGFVGLYQACYQMTEAVRDGTKLENEALFKDVEKEYHKTIEMIKKYQN